MTLQGDARVADLQLHSSASDGTDTPSEVVRRAHALGFSAIALTDHDTMAGVTSAQAAAAAVGMLVIPACELSSLDDDERQIDILAYGVSPTDADFLDMLATIRAGRLGRAHLMVAKLNELGHAVSWERVQAIAAGDNVGRPHVARAMVEAGVVPDVKSAFTSAFILEGGACYVQRVKVTPHEAITGIRRAGGVAVAAHPGRTGLTDTDIARLVSYGLRGLEVLYPQHNEAQRAHFGALAQHAGLVVTGGSDDHGDANEGRLLGSVRLPYGHVNVLLNEIAEAQQQLHSAHSTPRFATPTTI